MAQAFERRLVAGAEVWMHKVADLVRRPLKFRFEADMIPQLRHSLPRLAFRHESESPVQVFTEVPAVQGVPDVAGIRFIDEAIAVRQNAGVRPLANDIEVRTVLALGSQSTSISELAASVGTSAGYMRRAVLPLLCDLGWTEVDSGFVLRRPDALWVARRVVTVEAKLKNWKAALAQARAQAHSADAAYIALDSSSIRAVSPFLEQIGQSGVGVIAVDREGSLPRVLVRPRRQPIKKSIIGKHLLAERCLDMWQRGTHEGQIYPVFGRPTPSS